MFNFSCSIQNPFRYHEWKDISQRTYKVTKNKSLDMGFFIHGNCLIEVAFDLRWRGHDHAGPRLNLGVLGYNLDIALCDNRHWDYTNNRWEKHESNC